MGFKVGDYVTFYRGKCNRGRVTLRVKQCSPCRMGCRYRNTICCAHCDQLIYRGLAYRHSASSSPVSTAKAGFLVRQARATEILRHSLLANLKRGDVIEYLDSESGLYNLATIDRRGRYDIRVRDLGPVQRFRAIRYKDVVRKFIGQEKKNRLLIAQL